MSSAITDEKRAKIYNELADLMIDSMGRGEVDLKEAQEMGSYVLGKLDDVKLEEELFDFINALCKRWNIYTKVFIELQSEKETKQSEIKIAEIQNKLASFAN